MKPVFLRASKKKMQTFFIKIKVLPSEKHTKYNFDILREMITSILAFTFN
jgi:hypothetical protein